MSLARARHFFWLPSFVTLLGALAGAGALVAWPDPAGTIVLLALGLACDALDGALARALGAETETGRHLDLVGDSALAVATAWRVAPGPRAAAALTLALVVLQATMQARRRRVSGRWWITAAAIVLVAVGAR